MLTDAERSMFYIAPYDDQNPIEADARIVYAVTTLNAGEFSDGIAFGIKTAENAQRIATALNEQGRLPALLAEGDELRAENKRLREALAEMTTKVRGLQFQADMIEDFFEDGYR